MRQRIELYHAWKAAQNGATNVLKSAGVSVPRLPIVCPLSLDELLAAEFDLARMIERVKDAVYATVWDRPQ